MRWAAAIAVLVLAACAAAEAPAQPEAAPTQTTGAVIPLPQTEPPPEEARQTLDCAGAFTQGGVALCRTVPGAQISVDGIASGVADEHGWAVIGFNREHGPRASVGASISNAMINGRPVSIDITHNYDIASREFDIQRINGLPQETVTPSDPAVLERIRRESALKQQAFASMAPLEGFLDGFILPVEGGVVTGRWGNQRVLNGTPSTPHFGYDIAVPEGTPIRAPAAGVVTLAEADMHYEGGLVFVDHGQGLITMYLHMSRLDVEAGETVSQGQVIGAVGSRGRATGPHLCWRMRWRERQLDPSVAIDGLAAARAELLQ